MHVLVAKMYEDFGRPLSRNRAVTLAPSHAGELTITEEHDRQLRRSVRTAYLRRQGDGVDVVPPLRDAVVLFVRGKSMTISGFETDTLTQKCSAQSWYAEIAESTTEST